MNPKLKALINSSLRPAKTSALNPYAMRKTPHDEFRVSPRLAAIAKSGATGPLSEIAENKAAYVTSKVDARITAADMARRYRKTKTLSARDRLIALDARLTEFARGDQTVRWVRSLSKPRFDATGAAPLLKNAFHKNDSFLQKVTGTANGPERTQLAGSILRERRDKNIARGPLLDQLILAAVGRKPLPK